MPKDYHESFAEEIRRRNGEKNPKPDNSHTIRGVILSLIAGLITFYIIKIFVPPPVPSTISQDNTKNIPPKPTLILPPGKVLKGQEEKNIPPKRTLPLPPSGVIKKHNSSRQENLGRIRIFLRAPKPEDNSGLKGNCSGQQLGNNNHAFVKLLDYNSKKVIITAFIRSGDMIEIPVPSGTYRIRIAEGDQWYGQKDMFGSKTISEMTEKDSDTATKFEFKELSGYELGFYCSSGNLKSKPITDTDESLEK